MNGTQPSSMRAKLLIRRLAPFMGLILMFIAGTLLNGGEFLNMRNQLNVLGRVSIKALPAVGMTLVIITAGIDLSVGSIVSLASVITAMLLMGGGWTKATSLALPVFTIAALILGFMVVSRLSRRAGLRGGAAAGAGTAGGAILAAACFAWGLSMVHNGFSTVAVLLVVPAAGAVMGALNGLVISKGRIQPFIVTLGMMSAAVGLAKYIAGKGGQIHTIYYESASGVADTAARIAPRSFETLNSAIAGLIPVTGVFFLAAVVVVYFILTRLRFGRYIYAIGGNEETARLSGIDVDRVKTATYAISSGLAALAGVLYCAAYTQGKADAGITWELDAIAAVVIGGTSLMGGRGSVVGTMLGVLVLGYLANILNLQEVSSEVQDILKGVIIIGAVLVQEGMVARWFRLLRRSRAFIPAGVLAILLAAGGGYLIFFGGADNDAKYRIGFSQVTVKEPWRVVFNEKLARRAAELGDIVDLVMLDADDKTENQVAHVETFITRGMDAILISPKEASGPAGVVREATEAGIPVIVLDRELTYQGYAAFVGGNNLDIGRAAGKYVVELLGGQGNARGVVYEICGGLASTPAQERRDGFHEFVDREPGITVLGGLDGDWKLDRAKAIAQDALQVHDDIDIIYAHNDPMAYGAYQAAKERGVENDIVFIGIDGLPQEGCVWVRDGILTATFLYPTPGAAGLDLAVDILEGRHPVTPGEKITLPTARITKENVDDFLK